LLRVVPMNRRSLKRLPSLLISAVTGALVGLVLAVGGALRTQSELLPGEKLSHGLDQSIVVGLATGTVGGIVYWATGPLRQRGGWRFFFAWILVGFIGMGAVAIPMLFGEFSLFWLIFWLLTGPGVAIGLALTEREIRR
jgi:hypothetical protein